MSICRTNREAKLISGQITGHLLPADAPAVRSERSVEDVDAEVMAVQALRAMQPSLTLLEAIDAVQRARAGEGR
jgi:hypothetical protein